MYKIGVDLGGTNIAAGITDQKGKLIYKDSIKTRKGVEPEEIIKDIYEIASRVISDQGLTEKDIQHIGIGIPGTIDYRANVIEYAPNIGPKTGFENVPIGKIMAQYTNIPILVENDANCAALGEAMQGAARNYNNSLVVTLGTGVGVGVVIDGKLMRGNVETGHHIINTTGPVCGCGRKGCLEAYVSATALIRDAKAANSPKILELAGGDVNDIEAKNVFDAAETDDPKACELIENYLFYLSIGFSNFANCYPVQAIIIGGGIGKQGDKLITPLLERLRKNALGGTWTVDILTAELGNDAGIIGAAMLG
ncbi:MAG: ROK family protein [Defluviitaleaceae bacterium]|nr:ROK family protein [Defluviitaleaceae bacterium]